MADLSFASSLMLLHIQGDIEQRWVQIIFSIFKLFALGVEESVSIPSVIKSNNNRICL